MKLLLSCLLLVALAGTALAQTTIPQAMPIPAPYGQPVAQTPVVHNYGALAGPISGCADGGCCPAPAPCCVREPAIKKIIHVNYCNICEPFCVPKCSCCLLSCFGCGGGCGSGCGACDGPYVKSFLMKKVCVEECPITKCVPSCALTFAGGLTVPAGQIVPQGQIAPQGQNLPQGQIVPKGK